MLISLSILSWIYQSLISAESMQLAEFPSLHQLFRKEGYRFWVRKTQSVISFFRFRISNVTSVGIKRFLGVEPSSPKIYFEGEGADNIATYSRHVDMGPHVFAVAARLKALLTTLFFESVLSAIGRRVAFIDKDLVCKVYYPTADFPVPYRFTIRVWSYLSEKYGSFLTISLESGCSQRILRLKQATVFLKIRKMRLSSANSFIEPKPIGLISAVGTSCWVHCGFGGVLLLGCTANNTALPMTSFHTGEKLPFSEFQSSLLTQAIFEFESFNLLPVNSDSFLGYDDDDDEYSGIMTNVSLQNGYFRYQQKLMKFCLLFLLLTSSFFDTANSIQKSGYGTSPNVLFLVETTTFSIPSENELLNGFENNLFQLEGPPFHASLVFYSQSPQIFSIFCYFCPEKFIMVEIPKDQISLLNQLASSLNEVNSKGYGKTFLIEDKMSQTLESEPCLKYYSNARVRSNLFGEHVNCFTSDVWELSWTQKILNFTATVDQDAKNLEYHKWFLRLRIGEGTQQEIRQAIIYSRGHILVPYDEPLSAMACLYTKSSRGFFDFTIISAFDWWTWICLLATVLIYGFVFQNFWNGIDTLWIFFGISVKRRHKRVGLASILLAFYFLNMIYQSLISAESMQPAEFPSLKDLISKDGYRFWVIDKKSVVTFFGNRLHKTKWIGLKKFLGVEVSSPQIYFQGEGADSILTYDRNDSLIPQVFATAARLKALVTTVVLEPVLSAIGKKVVFIDGNLGCKNYYPSREFPIPYRFTIRMWSYLSDQFKNVLTTFLEAGCLQRIYRLNRATTLFKMGKMRLSSAKSFIEPKPIGLMSAIGTGCWIHCGIGGAILLGWCVHFVICKLNICIIQTLSYIKTKIGNFQNIR
ncbi:unnamed protein product [Orchesella dallaii]|uniref:Uncharacterized protein n=1 Tax=Orchesella dallaii TaxID=48710 RepID=A0ABP1PJ63_9HEXA